MINDITVTELGEKKVKKLIVKMNKIHGLLKLTAEIFHFGLTCIPRWKNLQGYTQPDLLDTLHMMIFRSIHDSLLKTVPKSMLETLMFTMFFLIDTGLLT